MPTVSYLVEIKPSGSWIPVPNGSVLDVNGSESTGGSDDNPFAFGEMPRKDHTVKFLRSAVEAYNTGRVPIRITTIIDGVPVKSFVGIRAGYNGDASGNMDWRCESFAIEVSARSRNLYSLPFEHRAFATATTATSVEDPLNPSYEAGPINWAFWQTGGRPWEQVADYPAADYYYSCEHSTVWTDVIWFAGEDGWQNIILMAQAAGGQVYQDNNGVMRFRSILNVGDQDGGPDYTFASTLAAATDALGVLGDASDDGDTSQFATRFTCTYTPRLLRPMQEVIDDSTVRLVKGSDSAHVIPLVPQWPIRQYSLIAPGILAADKINAVFLSGGVVPQHATAGYGQSVSVAAQRLVVTIDNNTAWPFVIRKVKVDGEPWLAGESGFVEVGSGDDMREYVDNVFIQHEDQAKQLCGMGVAFYGEEHPIVRITGLPFNVDRYLGELVYLVCPEINIDTPTVYVIVGRDIKSIHEVDYQLALLGNAPVATDFFEVGTTDYTGQTKYVAW